MKKYVIFIVIVILNMSSVFQVWSYSDITLLASYSIDTETQLGGFPIGGLSEIKFVSKADFIALSDARSTKKEGPSRFYKGSILFKNGVMEKVRLQKYITLKNENKEVFSEKERDPEAFVFIKKDKMLVASERGNILDVVSSSNGRFLENKKSFLPQYYYGDNGLRSNQGIEGMSLASDGAVLFLATESALIQDGDVATEKNSAVSRIVKLQKLNNEDNYQIVGEYGYEVSKIPTVSKYGLQDNGVSAILALDKNRLLVVERNGYAVKKGYDSFDFNIRLYIVDVSNAENIKGKKNITKKNVLAKKTFFVSLSSLLDVPDNVEGIAWGPRIDNAYTIFLVTDNNFSKHQATKFYQLAIPENMLYP